MRERRLFMTLGIVLAVLALGVAYAVTLSVDFSITGSATAMVSEENFDVKFTKVSEVTGTGDVDTKGSTAKIDSRDPTRGTFEFTGFITKGQTQSATWTISNENEAELYAHIVAYRDLEVTDREYFRGRCDLGSDVIEPNGTTTLTVTVECIKTPTNGTFRSGVMEFGFSAIASADEELEKDGEGNPIVPPGILPTVPIVTAQVSNITNTGATITAQATDEGGEELQYTLKINGTIYEGPSTTNTWTLTNLTDYTKYTYTVEVTDGEYTGRAFGNFTTTCGHNGNWQTTIPATCTTAGIQVRTCTVCGATETGTVNALGHNWVNGICSRCGIECNHTFVNGTCTICGEKEVEAIPTTTDYVGCYADIDRDGKIDGVIFADQGYGQVGDGEWTDGSGTYEIPKITSGLKEYEITQESYTIQSTDGKWDSNPHPVISPVEGTSGTNRFYVMALNDFTTSSSSWITFYWYYNANKYLDDPMESSDQDFGEGYTKTGEMITRWNNKTYGAQHDQDIWKHIQTQYSNGWFIPSKCEWSAFGGELGEATLSPALTTSNYSSTYGLSSRYWSSSQRHTYYAYFANFSIGYMRNDYVYYGNYVRLCTTF